MLFFNGPLVPKHYRPFVATDLHLCPIRERLRAAILYEQAGLSFKEGMKLKLAAYAAMMMVLGASFSFGSVVAPKQPVQSADKTAVTSPSASEPAGPATPPSASNQKFGTGDGVTVTDSSPEAEQAPHFGPLGKSAGQASVSVADSASGPRPPKADSVSPAQEAKVKRMKDILFRLVRQDEYLDEAIETLDTPNAKPAATDIFALSLSLKMIKGNLDHVNALNKIQLTEIQPESNLSLYTKTILSYSAKMNKKVNRVRLLASTIAAKNKKAAMRDAVSAKKGGKARGKNIAQLLEEQQAMEQLSTDIKSLKSSLNRLTATSRWLYIVSK